MTDRKAVSLFSGCGGFCEGVKRAGFKITVAVENDKFAVGTYRRNFPEVPLFDKDVQRFLNTDGEDHQAAYDLSDVDLVFGGPPCQGYSQIGTRNLSDERNTLYEQYARVVSHIKPRVFLMENVPNLLLLNKGHYRDLILKKFREIGYSNATYLKVSAADHGVPQLRNRVIFFGTRDDVEFPYDLKILADNLLKSYRVSRPWTVREAICDLPAEVVESGQTTTYPTATGLNRFLKQMRLGHDAVPYDAAVKRGQYGEGELRLHNHHTKEIQERRRHLISLLKPGRKGDSLPKEVWNGLRPEKWRRLDPESPSYTILAQMHRDLSEWVHPWLPRWITVREAARLQSFHDGFVFEGSEWQQLKQVGNAVPPLLAYDLGRMAEKILAVMENPDTLDDAEASAYQHQMFATAAE